MEISLALGGGGIKGIAHIGVLEALAEAGFQVRAIAGTSSGALVGAVYAAGFSPIETLAILESLNPNRLYARQSTDRPSLIGYTGLAEALVDVLGDCQFSDLKIPFACTAVDILTSQELYLNEGRLIDAVLASIAIPGVFPPKVRGDAELVDGGVLDPVPVALARYMAPRLPVVAVALNPAREGWQQVPAFDIASAVPLPIPSPIMEGFARLRVAQAFRIFVDSMDITSRMMTELRLEVDKPEVIIRPEVYQYGMLDVVDPKELIAAGRKAVVQALPAVRQAVSWPNRVLRSVRSRLSQGNGPNQTGQGSRR